MFSLLRGSSPSPEPSLVDRVGSLVLADPAVAEVPWLVLAYQFCWAPHSLGPGTHGGTWAGQQRDPKTREVSECSGTWAMRDADAYWLLRRARNEYPLDAKPCGFEVTAVRRDLAAPGQVVSAAWDLPNNSTAGR